MAGVCRTTNSSDSTAVMTTMMRNACCFSARMELTANWIVRLPASTTTVLSQNSSGMLTTPSGTSSRRVMRMMMYASMLAAKSIVSEARNSHMPTVPVLLGTWCSRRGAVPPAADSLAMAHARHAACRNIACI